MTDCHHQDAVTAHYVERGVVNHIMYCGVCGRLMYRNRCQTKEHSADCGRCGEIMDIQDEMREGRGEKA